MNEETKVQVSVNELAQLRADSKFLGCLIAAGVDNWDGYDYAQELMDGEGDDDESYEDIYGEDQ